MEIKITVRQFGKKQAILTESPLHISSKNTLPELQQLLLLIVEHQVNAYEQKIITSGQQDSIPPSGYDYIQVLTDRGKAGFGTLYNTKTIGLESAQQNVLQAFKDGIYTVFQGDTQLTSLTQTVDLTLNSTFTFIRLTFLTGSYW